MEWPELYEIVKTQAYYAVLRYEEPERRKDKIQELVCQAFEKYQRDTAAGREIKKQEYKCFITQRAKQVDQRSVCKKGYGGTSTMDPLGFYRRRPDSPTSVVEFDDWMINIRGKENVDNALAFNIDFEFFLAKLDQLQRKIIDLLIQGFKTSEIVKIVQISPGKVKQVISQLRELFVKFFHLNVQYA